MVLPFIRPGINERPQNTLEGPVEALYFTIGLGVEGGGMPDISAPGL